MAIKQQLCSLLPYIRRIVAIIILLLIYIMLINVFDIFPLEVKFSQHWYTLAVICIALTSVGVSYQISPLSPLTITLVMLVFITYWKILDPAFFISLYAGVDLLEGIKEVMDGFDWYRYLSAVFAVLFAALFFRFLRHHN
ncbi:MAG: hypothetical protein GWO30_07725 [Gammaproteobacteria bacterium]|nr:hypothetical protein [Gammaproteobacteria bacterium]NIQ11901.1 hypothetical protein [Gammaproteobacteria bacterium]NIR26472.1 hypothetical protein [Gammaproteobacteria bacterium]NIV26310.1 hypothetical protein [Gammaproteobacteria bacterium]NIW11318.1 hypothetical protein [Gammaproteobacteria bacterium]